ncbi:MAG: hypothetical protein ACM34I_04695 [bacterium]
MKVSPAGLPIVKNVTGGTLLSIPVRVSGDLKNPDVSSFTLSDADTGLIGVVTKTIKKPLQIIEPAQ